MNSLYRVKVVGTPPLVRPRSVTLAGLRDLEDFGSLTFDYQGRGRNGRLITAQTFYRQRGNL